MLFEEEILRNGKGLGTIGWPSSRSSKIKDRFSPVFGFIESTVTIGFISHWTYITRILELKRIIHNPYVSHKTSILKSTICKISTTHLCCRVRGCLPYVATCHLSSPFNQYRTVPQRTQYLSRPITHRDVLIHLQIPISCVCILHRTHHVNLLPSILT